MSHPTPPYVIPIPIIRFQWRGHSMLQCLHCQYFHGIKILQVDANATITANYTCTAINNNNYMSTDGKPAEHHSLSWPRHTHARRDGHIDNIRCTGWTEEGITRPVASINTVTKQCTYPTVALACRICRAEGCPSHSP